MIENKKQLNSTGQPTTKTPNTGKLQTFQTQKLMFIKDMIYDMAVFFLYF